jgi:glycine cleavage system H lipoate-binding protein
MATIEKFLGRRVEMPEDRRYDLKQGLWGRCVDDTIVFGLTEPALVLYGGVKDIDWLVDESQPVRKGDAALFAITGKILYLESPIAGSIQFNKTLKGNLPLIQTDPYKDGWLFLIQPDGGIDAAYQSLAPIDDYLEHLRRSEGGKNPEGVKGGVSGMCKAVYSGIGEQTI